MRGFCHFRTETAQSGEARGDKSFMTIEEVVTCDELGNETAIGTVKKE
jgi:hypothetical protein